jgi:adenylate kinase family enzyme
MPRKQTIHVSRTAGTWISEEDARLEIESIINDQMYTSFMREKMTSGDMNATEILDASGTTLTTIRVWSDAAWDVYQAKEDTITNKLEAQGFSVSRTNELSATGPVAPISDE